MYVTDFGIRRDPPCGDCDADGHCTMNCGPVRGRDMMAYRKLGTKPEKIAPKCLVCQEAPVFLEETGVGEWRIFCFGCRMRTFDFPKKQDAIAAYQTFIGRIGK